MALANLGKAAASAVLVGATKDTFWEGHDFQTLRKNYQGVIHRACLVFFSALVERVEERPFQGRVKHIHSVRASQCAEKIRFWVAQRFQRCEKVFLSFSSRAFSPRGA
jgi:hypothetical protein